MRTSKTIYAAVMLMAVLGATSIATISNAASSADAAIQAAAKRNRYVFVTFYKGNDGATKSMQATVKSIQGKLAGRADFVSVDVGKQANRAIASRYGADRSPMPLTIVLAPNGAVTAGFPGQIRNTDMSGVFVSDGMASVLKVLQGGKLAAVCIQNSRTTHNRESLAAAQGLKNQAQFRGAVEVVKIDPSNRGESQLMKQWQVDTTSTDAQIVVIAPPGRVVGKFDGTTTTSLMAAVLVKSLSAGGGCCSGGGSCAPK
jgi:hypothetical protein